MAEQQSLDDPMAQHRWRFTPGRKRRRMEDIWQPVSYAHADTSATAASPKRKRRRRRGRKCTASTTAVEDWPPAQSATGMTRATSLPSLFPERLPPSDENWKQPVSRQSSRRKDGAKPFSRSSSPLVSVQNIATSAELRRPVPPAFLKYAMLPPPPPPPLPPPSPQPPPPPFVDAQQTRSFPVPSTRPAAWSQMLPAAKSYSATSLQFQRCWETWDSWEYEMTPGPFFRFGQGSDFEIQPAERFHHSTDRRPRRENPLPPSSVAAYDVQSGGANETDVVFTARQTASELRVGIERVKHNKATVTWNYWPAPDLWQVTVGLSSSNADDVYYIGGRTNRMDLPKTLTARAKYKVTVKALEETTAPSFATNSNQVPDGYRLIAECSTEFLAGFVFLDAGLLGPVAETVG